MSTTLSEWCNSNGWKIVYDFNSKPNLECKYIVVLRDPVQRWCSGVQMYLRCEQNNLELISDDAWSICLDRMILDPHTERQCMSYHGLKLYQMLPIDFDSPDFSVFEGLKIYKKKERSHPERIVKFLANERQVQRLKHIYRYDYYLRNWLLNIDLPKFETMDINDPSIWKD